MTSATRLLNILGLFSIERPTLRVEDVSNSLGYTRAMSYRFIKTLSDAGFIAPAGNGTYALGARVLELERLMDLTDPLLHASHDVVAGLVRGVENRAVLVCSLYGDKVVCINFAGAEQLKSANLIVPIRRARGVRFPLFSGAASLAILAALPPHRIKALYLRFEKDIAESGLATNWNDFRKKMSETRKLGFATTTGQLNKHLTAIAVPIILPGERQVIGSLAQIMLAKEAQKGDTGLMARQLIKGANEIVRRMDTGVTVASAADSFFFPAIAD
jgi:DNA-binding IclR family transcriptional regulator